MAPKIDPLTMTPTQIAMARRKWADYIRVRKHPTKPCRRCRTVYPNTQEHFAISPTGRVLSVCIGCAGEAPRPERLEAPCPICRFQAVLVRDHAAPEPIDICWSCLRLANAFEAAARDTLYRIARYVDWRKKPAPGGESGTGS